MCRRNHRRWSRSESPSRQQERWCASRSLPVPETGRRDEAGRCATPNGKTESVFHGREFQRNPSENLRLKNASNLSCDILFGAGSIDNTKSRRLGVGQLKKSGPHAFMKLDLLALQTVFTFSRPGRAATLCNSH